MLQVLQLEEHSKRVWAVDFSRVDPLRLASASDDGSVRVWSVNQEGSVARLNCKVRFCTAFCSDVCTAGCTARCTAVCTAGVLLCVLSFVLQHVLQPCCCTGGVLLYCRCALRALLPCCLFAGCVRGGGAF